MSASRQLVGGGFAVFLFVAAIGCGSSNKNGGMSMDEMADQMDAQNAVRKEQEAATAAKAAAEQQAAASQPVEPEIRNVDANSMKKGQKLREGGGYLRAVAGARFWAEHQMILNNITHAMQLYNAEKGYYPKTQEQFMSEIIKPNEPATKLPELPEGWEYFYDPNDPLQLKMVNKGGGDPKAVE